MRRSLVRLLTGLLALPVIAVAGPAPAAEAAPVTRQLVRETAAAGTPHVLNGRVYSIARVGDTMFLGGTFTSARDEGSAVTLNRSRLLAFDARTGRISTSFAPVVDGNVNVVLPGPNGTVFIGGQFNNVGGQARGRLAQLRVSDGSVVGAFDPATVSGAVNDLRLHDGRLFVGGTFTHIANQAQLALATVDPVTGAFDPYVRNQFSGTQNGGFTSVLKMDVSPQAERLMAIGNFAQVDGASRRQAVVLDLDAAGSTLANWQTSFYESTCSRGFNTYMRDLDISDDGTFAVLSTSGAYGGSSGACDTAARFEVDANGTGLAPSWVDYTGGDTQYAVEITDAAVYVGGHARWQNNPFAGDKPGAGAVARTGVAALDPENGLPLTWNPTRDRGVGVFDFRFDQDGLWLVSDTERIGTDNAYRPRVALLPPGGPSYVAPVAASLPNDLYSVQGAEGVVRRHVDGDASEIGPVSDVADPGHAAAGEMRGAFMLNGDLFTAWSDRKLVRQSYDGTTYGAETAVDTHDQLVPLADWASDLASANSMTFHRGRIYYTLPGTAPQTGATTIYYRYFTPESNVVGAHRHEASTSVTGLPVSTIRGMFISDGLLWTADHLGNLRRTQWADGRGPGGRPVPSTTQTVSGPSVGDGRTWAGPMFLFQDAQGRPAAAPPAAEFSSDCTSLDCAFDGTASTGDVASYDWDFGDGANATGAKPSHAYAASGTYPVTLTVTSSKGATSEVTRDVSVTRVNADPVADFSSSCDRLVCAFDSSASEDPDGSIESRSWTFGDGQTSAQANPEHTYAAAGTYDVVLTVTDNDGASHTRTRSVTVSAAAAPTVAFVAGDSTNGNRLNHTVTVPSSVQAGDLLVLAITLNNTSHAFTPPAGWTQQESVTNASRGTRGFVWTRTATGSDAGSAVTVSTDGWDKSDLSVVAYRSSTGSARVVSSAIAFDAASATEHTSPTVGAASADTVLVTYFGRKSSGTQAWQPVAGQKTRTVNTGTGGGNIAAILVDSDAPVPAGQQGGLTGTLSAASGNVVTWSARLAPESVTPPPNVDPVADFSSSCDRLVCAFDSSASEDPDGSIESRSWTFGDGQTSAQANPEHTYAAAGTYDVVLTVTDNDGASHTRTRSVTVSAAAAPTVAFVAGDSTNGNRLNHTVTVPSSVQAGDLLVLAITLNNTSHAFTPPAGWTQREWIADTSQGTRGFVWTRTATGSDAGSAVTVSTDGWDKSDLSVVAYRSSTGSARVVSSAIAFDAASATEHTSPTVGAASADTVLVTYFGRKSSGTQAWQPVAGQKTRTVNTGTGGGNIAAILVDSDGPVPAGQQGGLTGTLSAASGKVVTWSMRVGAN